MRKPRDKAALVTGVAPATIGGATATRLAPEGMKMIVAVVDAAAAQVIVDEITSAGGYAVARDFDTTEESDSKGLIDIGALFPGFGADSD